MMSAYSAVSVGHAHPRILAALTAQANRLAVPSRAYYSDRLGPFLAEICRLTGLDAVVPMNTGAEAVETAVKAARRWGYRVKGIAKDKAEIIVADGNFHGRTTTITSFSTEPDYRDGFGPFTPGFKAVPFGDLDAVERAITPDTAAVLIEPIQGEAGIIVPPDGYLAGPAPHLRRPQRAAHPRRGAVGPRPHRQVVRVSSTRASGRTGSFSARRWAAACCRCRRSSARANS